MPMQVTISRNRKTSENYNSEGYGVSLTVELDQTLLTKPQELQDKIAYLYREADAALDQQAKQQNGQAHKNGNGNGNPKPNGNGHGMTAAQRRAIQSIGQRLGLDVMEESRHELGTELEQLTVKQASRFIDHLKQLEQPAGNRNGGGR
ncbi:MAG: hypothetical protein WD768_13615 [Phycisphaeraceae bacterium]